jgi:hypothetical protein
MSSENLRQENFTFITDHTAQLTEDHERVESNSTWIKEANCADPNDDSFEKIDALTQEVALIVSKFGENKIWPQYDPDKLAVLNLEEEILCLETQIFSKSNNLNLKIDCKSKPKIIPPMHLSVVKHTGITSVNEMLEEAKTKRLKELRKRLNSVSQSTTSDPNFKQMKIARLEKEIQCLDSLTVEGRCENSDSDPSEVSYVDYEYLVKRKPGNYKMMIYIKSNTDELLPFKTYEKEDFGGTGMIGPKIREGDYMTPEGTFNIVDASPTSKYFTASRIDYENWKDRKEMLKGLPSSVISPASKGTAIMIHGAGGSVGCLSFKKNSESAYLTAIVRNMNTRKIPLKVSIYPTEMSDDFVESSSTIPGIKAYSNFWKELAKVYKKESERVNLNIKTINEVREKYDENLE